MRILVAGNLANMGFELTKALRKKNVDAKLLLPKNPKNTEDPKLLYPKIENEGYPDWLVWFNKESRSFDLNNWKYQIIKEMRKKDYEIIIALTEFPIFAIFSGKPFIVVSTGSDMRELIFEKSVKGYLYRLAYKKAKAILWSEPDKAEIIKKLKISSKAFFLGIPRYSNFHPEKVSKRDLEGKFVIFHPTRQDWIHKRNDLFLHAFNKLCSLRNDIFLIISNEGPDKNKAIKILSEGKGNGKFRFIPNANFEQLQFFYNMADVIVDQFGVGSFGMISIESMMCKKPVIIGLDVSSFKTNNIEIPKGMIIANSSEEILQKLNKIVSEEQYRKNLGEENRKYIEKYRNPEKMTEEYISICKKILK